MQIYKIVLLISYYYRNRTINFFLVYICCVINQPILKTDNYEYRRSKRNKK